MHASLAGFDSLQFVTRNLTISGGASGRQVHTARPTIALPEFVLCTGLCMSEESRTPCPGVPLRRADGSTCTCDERWPLLRCVEDAHVPGPRGHMRSDPCPAARTHRR